MRISGMGKGNTAQTNHLSDPEYVRRNGRKAQTFTAWFLRGAMGTGQTNPGEVVSEPHIAPTSKGTQHILGHHLSCTLSSTILPRKEKQFSLNISRLFSP